MVGTTTRSAGCIVAGRSVCFVSRAALDKDPRDVASMFDGVARRYDLTNTVLSLGQDRLLAASHPVGAGDRARREGAGPGGGHCGVDAWS